MTQTVRTRLRTGQCFSQMPPGRSVINGLRACLKMAASASLADVKSVRPARRQKRRRAVRLAKPAVSADQTVFSARQDAGLYGRRDARRYPFKQTLSGRSELGALYALVYPKRTPATTVVDGEDIVRMKHRGRKR
jgi:hypothetical protein